MNLDYWVYRRVRQGGNTGQSDALLNIDANSTLTFTMAERGGETWLFKGSKFYWITPLNIREAKDRDIQTLSSGSTSDFESIFCDASTPGINVSISSDGKTLTVTDTAAAGAGKGFEFLLWIQNGSNNDYVDPGIRNRW